MTPPNVTYEFYMNDVKLSTNTCRASFVSPYNKLVIKMKPDISLSYWEARITPDATHTLNDYDIGEGILADWKSNVATNVQTTSEITIDATKFTQGDGTYRISLYAKSSIDGSWDVTYLFFTVDNEKFVPTSADGLEVLTDKPAPAVLTVSFTKRGSIVGAYVKIYDGQDASGTLLGTNTGGSIEVKPNSGYVYITSNVGMSSIPTITGQINKIGFWTSLSPWTASISGPATFAVAEDPS